MNKKNTLTGFICFLVLYETACWMSMDAFTPALPSIKSSFEVSFRVVQLTITLWMAGGLLPQILIGPLSDRFGRKPILLIGAALFVVTSLACAYAQSFHQLLLARFFQGMVIPSMIIAGYAAVHELCDQKQAIQVVARMQSVTLLAPSIGPLLGGLLLTYTLWPAIFWCLSLWGAISFMGLAYVMPESLPYHQRNPALNLVSSFKQYGQCISNHVFMLYSCAMCGLLAIIVIWVSASPLLIIDHFHCSSLTFGLSQVFVFGAFIIGTKLIPRLSKQHTQYQSVITYGSLITILGGLSFLLSSLALYDQLLPMILCMMMVMAGLGSCFSVFMRLAIDSSDESMGIKMGMISLLQTIIATCSSVVVVIFFHNTVLSLALLIMISAFIPMLTIPFLSRNMKD